MAHNLRVRSESNSENEYRVEFTGGVEPESGIGGRDQVTDDGGACEGRVVANVDSYNYWGARAAIEADNPDDLQLSINGGRWRPATEFGATAFGDGGGSSGGGDRGGGSATPSIEARKQRASNRLPVSAVEVVDDAAALRDELDALANPLAEDVAYVLPDPDDHYAPGVIEATVDTKHGDPSLWVVGNHEDPYACEIRAPANLKDAAKDEHLHIEGLTFTVRSQLWGYGSVFARNCVFADRDRKQQSSVGGKPVCARLQDCELGYEGAPDDRASILYGSGMLHLDAYDDGCVVRTDGDAYFELANTAVLHIDGATTFASGEREVVEGTGVYPSDIGGWRTFRPEEYH